MSVTNDNKKWGALLFGGLITVFIIPLSNIVSESMFVLKKNGGRFS
jgi:hypothetical protein